MVSYYTALCVLSWMALGVLCILVWENSWIPREDKRLFYLTYGIIAFSAFAEWVGVQLSGNTAIPGWVLSLVKCVDYMLTPMAGGAIVAQMKLRNRRCTPCCCWCWRASACRRRWAGNTGPSTSR